MVSAKGNEATVFRNSLITFSGNNPSHVSAVPIIVHRVIIRIGRRVWPVPISHKVITTKNLEARTDAATKLSRVESVNNYKRSLEVPYRRVSVLDAAVDNCNSGPSSQDTIIMQLLDAGNAVDRVIRSGSIIAERFALNRVQNPDELGLVDRGYSSIVAGVVERRPERVLGAGMVALDTHAGKQVRVELLDDLEPGCARDLVEELGALGTRLQLHDVPPRDGGARR